MNLPTRPCSWCAAPVVQHRRPGRPKLYCRQGCRQRAYEHRHGLRHRRTERELPGQQARTARPYRGSFSGYERGGYITRLGPRLHALRPVVRPDGRDRRETLCGLIVLQNPGKLFQESDPDSCRTCQSIAAKRPLRYGIEPSSELARLRSVIEEAVEQRLPADDALRWLWENAPHRAAA